MIRVMENNDLAQCGMIYAKAFPMEHWGIDWTAENATEYLRDFFEQKRFVGYVYEENDEVLGCIFALCRISGSKEEIYIIMCPLIAVNDCFMSQLNSMVSD